MSLISILNACQTINATLSGVVNAPQVADYPATLSQYPTVLALPGPGVWFAQTGGLGQLRKSQRTIALLCFVAPDDIEDLGQVLTTTISLIEEFGTTYQALKAVGGATIMYSVGIGTEDEGMLRLLNFAGGKWFGFEFRLVVTEPRS